MKIRERRRRKLRNIIDDYISLFMDFTCKFFTIAQWIKSSSIFDARLSFEYRYNI